MVFCRAKFGRGLGFGNRLFAWARCAVFSDVHGVPMVAPLWFRPAIGQLFRGGVSYESYLRQVTLVGLFHKTPSEIGLLKYLSMVPRLKVIGEPADIMSMPSAALAPDGTDYLVQFEEPGLLFQPLNGHSTFLLKRLRSITNQRYLSIADGPSSVPIGICVRLGNDFGAAVAVDGRITGLRKTPIAWFVTMLQEIRTAVGYPARAYVVSDGTPQQLSGLLSLPNVEFVRPGSAIGDLLLLSRSRVLLASGASSFAAWGAFLGQMPGATHPGQPLQWWKLEPQNAQYLGEIDCNNIDGEFMRQAAVALGAEGHL